MSIILWPLNWHEVCLDILKEMHHQLTRELTESQRRNRSMYADTCLYYVILTRLALNPIEIYFAFVNELSSHFTPFISGY
jgi:hypothetical protein